MADAMVESAVRQVYAATEGMEPQARAAAVAAAAGAAAGVPSPSGPRVIGFLWRALVLGLLMILAASLFGIIWTVLDGRDKTSPDVLVTVFTAALTGLLGLFVQSPSQG
jgi:hypothetical protein